MAKKFAKKFYESPTWQKERACYIAERRAIDGGLCEICKKRLGYIVHHKTPLTPSNINKRIYALDHSNLQYVCKPCHDELDGHFNDRSLRKHSSKPKRRYSFSLSGEVIRDNT